MLNNQLRVESSYEDRRITTASVEPLLLEDPCSGQPEERVLVPETPIANKFRQQSFCTTPTGSFSQLSFQKSSNALLTNGPSPAQSITSSVTQTDSHPNSPFHNWFASQREDVSILNDGHSYDMDDEQTSPSPAVPKIKTEPVDVEPHEESFGDTTPKTKGRTFAEACIHPMEQLLAQVEQALEGERYAYVHHCVYLFVPILNNLFLTGTSVESRYLRLNLTSFFQFLLS